MIRQSRAWCGVAVVFGVLAGCDKPPETGSGTAVSRPQVPADWPGGMGGAVRVTPCKFETVTKTIADAKGKVVLIDCWATWCGPCVESFPQLVAKHQKYGSKGLVVISVSTDDASAGGKVLGFLQRQNATFTNLHLQQDAAARRGLREVFEFDGSIPHAVLFDKSGTRVWSGHPMDRGLTALIEVELAKPGPAQG